jgi:hypothetical protein
MAAMKEHPGRCLQAIARTMEVLKVEFDDLTPADKVFVLTQVIWQYNRVFHMEMERRDGR